METGSGRTRDGDGQFVLQDEIELFCRFAANRSNCPRDALTARRRGQTSLAMDGRATAAATDPERAYRAGQ